MSAHRSCQAVLAKIARRSKLRWRRRRAACSRISLHTRFSEAPRRCVAILVASRTRCYKFSALKTLIHTLKYFARVDSPITQVSAAELALLTYHSRNAAVLVEVGTFEGATTRALGESTGGHVYSIDVFFPGRVGICYPEIIARHHNRRLKNVTILKGASADVGLTFKHSIDFLFIDADHSYEGVKADWLVWFPKVRINGVIAMHDCKYTKRMPRHQGSWDFYGKEITTMSNVEEIGAVESLVLLRKSVEQIEPDT